jgi:16S rRNA (adenine1518-N6/adenine1519-N6)-dimethyltransferase
MGDRDPFQRYLDRMAELGFRPSSTLGQNFLLDPSLHRWIAECAQPTAADTVVEIGVGLGFLTRELAARAGRVVAVELDARLLQIAREELGDRPNIEWVAGDALGGLGRTLHPAIVAAASAPRAPGARALVIANLPYAVSGPLLAELVAVGAGVDDAVLLVQKEMAQRVAATAGSADYGGLSAAVQSTFRAALLRDVPPDVFRPRPKVTSAILRLVRREEGPLAAVADEAERRQFLAFVRHLFRQRRKTLRTTLAAAAAAVGGRLPDLGDQVLQLRAETATADAIAGWWRASLA